MESTPPTLKRVKTRAVRSGGRLEGWFSGDNDLIERYRFETSTKVMNNPKVVCFDWLKSQKLDNVRRLHKDQSLKKFLEMKGNIYPNLIRVFYTNDVWTAVAGLKFSGLRINKGNLGVVEDFNKVQYYKSILFLQRRTWLCLLLLSCLLDRQDSTQVPSKTKEASTTRPNKFFSQITILLYLLLLI